MLFRSAESLPDDIVVASPLPSFSVTSALPTDFNISSSLPSVFTVSTDLPRGIGITASLPSGFSTSETLPSEFINTENLPEMGVNSFTFSSSDMDDATDKARQLIDDSSNMGGDEEGSGLSTQFWLSDEDTEMLSSTLATAGAEIARASAHLQKERLKIEDFSAKVNENVTKFASKKSTLLKCSFKNASNLLREFILP